MMPRPRYRRSYIAERRRRWAPVLPYWGLALALLLGLLVAPWLFSSSDGVSQSLRGMQRTSGAFPWRVYVASSGASDVTPVVAYLLSLLEAARLLIGEGISSPVAVLLAKLPGLLAWVGGGFLCLRALPSALGWPGARKAAAIYLLAAPIFVSAALRGEWDALVCLGLLGAVLATAREKLVLAGVLLGVAASVKLSALALAPVLLVYGVRKFGGRQLLVPALAGLATMGLLAAPIALAGRGDALARVYLEPGGREPLRSVSADNGWYLLDRYDELARHHTPAVRRDTRSVLSALPSPTFQRVGQALLGAYLAFVLWALWKRPTRHFLLLASAMAALALFILPTRAQEGYLLPAIALLAPLAVRAGAPRYLLAGLCVTGTLGLLPFHELLAAGNLALFVYGTWALLRAREAPVLYENPLDWPDARRAERTIASSSRRS